MGEKLQVRSGTEVVVAIVLRDPDGPNFSPYTFNNPSLAQIGIEQPLNRPVLDHVDVIRGMVTGFRKPGGADYAGAWPNQWLTAVPGAVTNTVDLTSADSPVPAAARNPSAALYRTFNSSSWRAFSGDPEFKVMSFRIPAAQVMNSQYLRLRGTNLPPSTPWETDANGGPLTDQWTNAGASANLRIPCNVVGSNVPANGVLHTGTIDGCPNHLTEIGGQKFVSWDVAAWADLWFYSNPIFIEVQGSSMVAGVR
jgi:hypothetical protein